MRGVRVVDALALGLGGATLIVILTGGVRLGGWALTRPEDFLVATAIVVGLRLLVAPVAAPRVVAARTVAGGVGVYLVVMGFIVISRHVALRTHAFDLGQYLQIIWNIAGGHGPESTIVPTYVAADRMHAWGDHFSPLFYGLAPLEWLAPGAASLLLAQTVALAAGGVALFGFARPRVGDGAAAALALLYLVNPSLHGINIRDIHPAAFAIPLLLGAALAFDRGRHVWCVVALLATLACREDAAVAVVGFGVWLAVARGRWLVGGAVAALATAMLAVEVTWLMPGYLGGAYDHLNRYRHLGGSLGEILLSLALRPWRWIAVVVAPAKLAYLGALLAPLGFLPLLAPRVAAAALPGLAMNLLSFDPKLFHYQSQYQSFILPFLVLAAVDGYARLRSLVGPHRLWARHGPASALGAAFVLGTILTARTVNDLSPLFWRRGPSQHAAYALMARVPPDAAVSAYERLVPHLATRREVYVFPRGVPASEYVLDLETRAAPRVPSDRYEELARAGPWVLWRRR